MDKQEVTVESEEGCSKRRPPDIENQLCLPPGFVKLALITCYKWHPKVTQFDSLQNK